ncbi:GNAT family N-acetyltransferase [Marinomonas balearica]|uniref:Acetyltransferase (GNAT) family protein n=1 Tax=Marinomonas balearica TaxID=491947 RepID=A0A4R6MB55_9GAMM|nr:GNAT family N-acetyltransferase [Marinomonas balearica]TDO98674.1 acetyltransferase (GNAT) family protein [Marinomonas balearica]
MELIKVDNLSPYLDDLVVLLIDGVDSSSSIGFLSPLSEDEAKAYWLSVNDDLQQNACQIALARLNDRVVGAVLLNFSPKANSIHRADIEKLMVHSDFRGQGIGTKLMMAVEKVAASYQKQLLVLDTRSDEPAFNLYKKMGWLEVGQIPNYTRNASGSLQDSSIFYKEIEPTNDLLV